MPEDRQRASLSPSEEACRRQRAPRADEFSETHCGLGRAANEPPETADLWQPAAATSAAMASPRIGNAQSLSAGRFISGFETRRASSSKRPSICPRLHLSEGEVPPTSHQRTGKLYGV